MRANTASMLAAKSDEQDRRMPPAGNDAPLAPDCDPGEAAADWREGMLALAGLMSAIRWR
jgi:MYXO-CTERM domain-containing protein